MSTLPSCKFWEKCYRKNPDHLKQYQHPFRQSTTDDKDDDGEVETKQTDSQKVTDCKPSEEDDGTTRGENRKELTSEDQTKRKRRASYDSGEEGRGGDDDKQNVSNRQKKMKLLNRAEASANEKTIENSRTDKIGEREKHLRQDSGEKGIPEEDDAEKDDDDVDEDDDFLAIVYTGKKDVKIDDDTSTSSVTDQKPLSSLPLGELLQVCFFYPQNEEGKKHFFIRYRHLSMGPIGRRNLCDSFPPSAEDVLDGISHGYPRFLELLLLKVSTQSFEGLG